MGAIAEVKVDRCSPGRSPLWRGSCNHREQPTKEGAPKHDDGGEYASRNGWLTHELDRRTCGHEYGKGTHQKDGVSSQPATRCGPAHESHSYPTILVGRRCSPISLASTDSRPQHGNLHRGPTQASAGMRKCSTDTEGPERHRVGRAADCRVVAPDATPIW